MFGAFLASRLTDFLCKLNSPGWLSVWLCQKSVIKSDEIRKKTHPFTQKSHYIYLTPSVSKSEDLSWRDVLKSEIKVTFTEKYGINLHKSARTLQSYSIHLITGQSIILYTCLTSGHYLVYLLLSS